MSEQLAEHLKDKPIAYLKTVIPVHGDLSAEGRIVPDHVVESMLRQSLRPWPSMFFNHDWYEEQQRREAAMSKRDKLRRRLHALRAEASWRLAKAWDHLRGIECPTDY